MYYLGGEVRVEVVSSQCVRRRQDLSGHPAEPVEPHLRHRRHPDFHTVSAQRP